MKKRFIILTVTALALGSIMPAPLGAQLGAGALGEIVKDKLDKSAEAIATAGQKSEGASSTPARAVKGQAASLGNPIHTIIVTDLPISIDVLNRFSTGLAAEVTERDRPAKRARCLAGLANIHAVVALPPVERADAELRRCGPEIPAFDAAHYAQVGSLSGAFTPDQYASLKLRVAPYCEATDPENEQVPNSLSVYSNAERIALGKRCRILLPSLRKVGVPPA